MEINENECELTKIDEPKENDRFPCSHWVGLVSHCL